MSYPNKGNKCYIRQVSGGYNGAIQGSPKNRDFDVLANCVGWANGRFNELNKGVRSFDYQLICNAEKFVDSARRQGLSISQVPSIGAIMCWEGEGNLAGHVAIVEKVIDNNTVYTSESSYAGASYYNSTRNNSNGNWGLGGLYRFQGFIVNPNESLNPTLRKATTQDLEDIWMGRYGNEPQRTQNLINAGIDSVDARVRINNGEGRPTPKPTSDIKAGDKVKFIGDYDYNSTKLATWTKNHIFDVIQISDQRVVIGKGNTVTAAVRKSDCIKV